MWPDEFAGVLTVPHGVGVGRAEGMNLVRGADGPSIPVVYDAPSKERKAGDGAIRADVFELP